MRLRLLEYFLIQQIYFNISCKDAIKRLLTSRTSFYFLQFNSLFLRSQTLFHPSPPPYFHCLSSFTTTTFQFSVFHHHHTSIIFPPPPQAIATTTVLLSSTTTFLWFSHFIATTTTFVLSHLDQHHPRHNTFFSLPHPLILRDCLFCDVFSSLFLLNSIFPFSYFGNGVKTYSTAMPRQLNEKPLQKTA